MIINKLQMLTILDNFSLKYEYRKNNKRLPHVVYDPLFPEEKKEFSYFNDAAHFVEGLYRGAQAIGGLDGSGPISFFAPRIRERLAAL